MKTMQFTIQCNKWDIVLVPFPFTDLTATKKRPALIISPDDYNQGEDLVVVFVTSHITGMRKRGDYLIQYWKESGLPKQSLIRMKFATVSKDIILNKIGTLDLREQNLFEQTIVGFFASPISTLKK